MFWINKNVKIFLKFKITDLKTKKVQNKYYAIVLTDDYTTFCTWKAVYCKSWSKCKILYHLYGPSTAYEIDAVAFCWMYVKRESYHQDQINKKWTVEW